MKIIKHLKQPFKQPSIVTIGTFDGVHLGHQKILHQLKQIAQHEKLQSVVLTFFPHPRMVLQNDTSIKLINTIKEREKHIENMGIDFLYLKAFTKAFSQLTAADFVKNILVEKLNAKKIIIGYDHHFGKNRTANIHDLKQFGKQYNFEVIEIPAQDIDAIAVSSTKIRDALNQGNITKANSYLNYNFSLTGKVITGKGLGKKINFPTANIHVLESYKLIPKQGVYIVKTILKNTIYYGMLNIGTNPTVNQDSNQKIEVHFFNCNLNLYQKTITIKFLKRIRNEQKFHTVQALKIQLEKDKIFAINYLNENEIK